MVDLYLLSIDGLDGEDVLPPIRVDVDSIYPCRRIRYDASVLYGIAQCLPLRFFSSDNDECLLILWANPDIRRFERLSVYHLQPIAEVRNLSAECPHVDIIACIHARDLILYIVPVKQISHESIRRYPPDEYD